MTFRLTLVLTLTLLPAARAEETRFFRLAGPVASTITAFSADGYMTWTNEPTNATFTVQTASSLVGPSNWVDYIQVPVTNPATTHWLYDPNPPAGMALIPAGSYTMGDSFGEGYGGGWELPLHSVYVSTFYMDRYEVTKALWDDVCSWAITRGYNFDHAGLGKAANHPVHTISWYDMVKWCNARSQKEGLNVCYYTDASQASLYMTGMLDLTNACVKWTANGYRLPTEAEWEKAARGGLNANRFPWGNTITHSNANYDAMPGTYVYDVSPTSGFHPTFKTGGYPYTSPVGSFDSNGYGLHDMSGNIAELIWDFFDSTYYSQPAATQDNPSGPDASSSNRGVRGGLWGSVAAGCRCAFRYFYTPTLAEFNSGFRCVRGL